MFFSEKTKQEEAGEGIYRRKNIYGYNYLLIGDLP
jgi:hypothetical protein